MFTTSTENQSQNLIPTNLKQIAEGRGRGLARPLDFLTVVSKFFSSVPPVYSTKVLLFVIFRSSVTQERIMAAHNGKEMAVSISVSVFGIAQ